MLKIIPRLLYMALISILAAVSAFAQPQLSEIRIDQPGTDDDEYFELSGTPLSSLSGFTYVVIGDGSSGDFGVIENATDLTGESIPASGFFVAAESTFSLGTADLTTTLGFENSDNVTHLLVSGFTGFNGQDLDTDDDGTLDVTPWTQIDDCLALIETPGSGDETYCATELGPDDTFVPGHAFTCDDDWMIGSFDLGVDDTAGTANLCIEVAGVRINELRIDDNGPDQEEYFELRGAPSNSLDGLTYLVIGDDTASGVIEEIVDLSGENLAASGFFVAAEDSFTLGTADLEVDLNFENMDNVTHLVVASFTGALGQDLDIDDDGVLDLTPWSQMVDCVAVIDDPVGGDETYCAATVGPDSLVAGSFAPAHAFLCPGGWQIGAFDPPGTDDTPGAANAACTGTPFEIFEIQGAGLSSPVDGQTITTSDNIVTAVGVDGFFIQTPDARDDADPDTSNGIFVFTGFAPSVAVGDLVDVTAVVDEFFDLTELTDGPIVVVDASGRPLPEAIVLDDTRPSPDPESPSCAIELECYESMLVTIAGGSVCSGNQAFGTDPIAEVFISAGERCFRETGVEYPGLMMPPIPTWDGNPEVFELDPDKLGLPNQTVPGGATFDATGVIGFEFGDYEIWPTSFSFSGATLPGTVPPRRNDLEFTVGSLNLFRLFDDVDDPGSQDDGQVVSTAEYQRRLEKFSAYIREVLDAPDVVAIQEAEKLGVLQDLAARIAADDPTILYTAELIEGNDVGGIDVGFLIGELVTLNQLTQLGAGEILTFDGSLLHDRPPLLLEAEYSRTLPPLGGVAFPFAVMNNHTRSLSNIDDPTDGPRVRQKRLEQAQSIAQKAQDFQTTNPAVPLIVIGDLNAFEFTDGYVDVVGQIAGDFDPTLSLVSGPDLVDPDLVIWAAAGVSPPERYSFIFNGNAQVLDHALTSTTAGDFVRRVVYGRGNADAARDLINQDGTAVRSSDHDGLVIYLTAEPEIFTDGFESGNTLGWPNVVP